MPHLPNAKGFEYRRTAAFLAAPMVVPLSFLLWFLWGSLTPVWAFVGTLVAAFVSYAGTFIFGRPVYFALLRRGHTAFWIAPAVGFTIGALMWVIFSILFVLSLDQEWTGVEFAFSDPGSLLGILWGSGFGAVVGAIIWIIARPDIAKMS
jgi:hypothetical protein